MGKCACMSPVHNLLCLLQSLSGPASDLEGLVAAALCMQWRRKMPQRRVQGVPTLSRSEPGLQEASTKPLHGSNSVVKVEMLSKLNC